MRAPHFQEHDMSKFRRLLALVVATCISCTGFMPAANAGLISTEQVAASEGLRTAEQQRSHVLETLQRADVAQALAERGVNLDQARARVAALSDAEAAQMAAQIDTAPAGADGLLGTVVFVFVLLLITDVLGYTHIFPFVRPIR